MEGAVSPEKAALVVRMVVGLGVAYVGAYGLWSDWRARRKQRQR